MNCDFCPEDEPTREQNINFNRKSQSYKELFGSGPRTRRNKQLSRLDQHKISLKRRSNIFGNEMHIANTVSIKPEIVRQAITPLYVQQINPKEWIIPEKTIFIPPSRIGTASKTFSYTPKPQSSPPVIKLNEGLQRRPQNIKMFMCSPLQDLNKTNTTVIKFTHNQLGQKTDNQIKVHKCPEVQPLKVQLNQCLTPTIAEKQCEKDSLKIQKSQKITKQQLKRSTKKSESSLQKNPEKQPFTKYKALQLKKYNSVSSGIYFEDLQSSKLVKSMRANGAHLQDIQCKNTQSIADANDSSSQLSQIIIGSRELTDLKPVKMTSSDTKIANSTQKNSIEHKRSIIWESSRKQSYNQL